MKKSLITIGIAAALSTACTVGAQDDGTVIQKTEGGTVTMKPVKQEINIDPKSWDFLPDPVATVGAKKITKAEFIKIVTPQAKMGVKMYKSMNKEMGPEEFKELALDAAKKLVDNALLLGLAEQNGFKPTPELGEELYKKTASEYPEGAFEKMLKEQGYDAADVKSKMAEAMAIDKWIQTKVVPSAKIDDAAVEKYYNENKERFKAPELVRASHILIKAKDVENKDGKLDAEALKKAQEKAKADAKAEAEKILAELKAGGDFAKVAKGKSACPSGKEGGDLNYFPKGQMVPEFDKAVFSLEKDKLSDLVETKFGFHIIKKTDHKQAGFEPLDKIKNEIKEQLEKETIKDQVFKMLDQEREKVKPVIAIKEDVKAAAPAAAPADAKAAKPEAAPKAKKEKKDKKDAPAK